MFLKGEDFRYSPASTCSLTPPLDVNTLVNCVWRGDGKFRRARIIERRRIGDTDEPESYDYYVHYLDCEFLFMAARNVWLLREFLENW